jgi:hypothetical protein
MAKRLTQNLTSNYLTAANKLRPGKTKYRVIAYVESYEDISFWRSILSEYETDDLSFEVMLPSRTRLTRGKKTAMMNHLGTNLGTSMIACVDADYDFLMQGTTEFSKYMLGNPYVFHTYAYAIENLRCYSPGLHDACVAATLNDHKIFDFEAYLQTYSTIIYDLFVWSVWLYRRELYKDMPLTSLNNSISVNKLNIFGPDKSLNELRSSVNRKMAWLQRKYPEAKGKIAPLKTELESLGVRPDNTYMYIQGHHLFDNVVMQALDPVCTILRREREKEIKRLAEHERHMENELASYLHSQCPVEQTIRRSTAFKESEQFQQLSNDIEAFLERIKKQSEENNNPPSAEHSTL